MIQVGGSTEIEVKEKKDRVDDAMHATRAAIEEGIVPGGGVALLRARASVQKLKGDNSDVQAGINIVLKALEAPIRQRGRSRARGPRRSGQPGGRRAGRSSRRPGCASRASIRTRRSGRCPASRPGRASSTGRTRACRFSLTRRGSRRLHAEGRLSPGGRGITRPPKAMIAGFAPSCMPAMRTRSCLLCNAA